MSDKTDSPAPTHRPLQDIRPPVIFKELQRGVLGQDQALRFVSVAVYKHTTGKVPGNIMLIGNSGTGKTTIMNNIQHLYHEVPEYRPFQAMTIINANLLVDPDRMEFRPDRLFASVEQRARTILASDPGPEELKEAMEKATICIDEIDKTAAVIAGKPNPIGVVLQQGLLTLMEGEMVTYRTHAMVDGEQSPVTLDIDTAHMMFICGGAFEGLYDQVYFRVTKPGAAEKLRSEAIRDADGQIRIEQRFYLADFLKQEDLFTYGMVPQFMARFDRTILLNELTMEVLRDILLQSHDSPFVRSRRFFEVMGIELGMDDDAAVHIAAAATEESRTGARALRNIFNQVINPFEYDPWATDELEEVGEGAWRLQITAPIVKRARKKPGQK
jgi:ATP-dependent Clp protease ATP-binding subunit ClpX